MAKFFVGQRVRVACSISASDGEECRITALNVDGEESGVEYIGHEVDIMDERYGELCVFEPHELVPILDQNQPCDAEFKQSLDDLLNRISSPANGRVDVKKYIFKP